MNTATNLDQTKFPCECRVVRFVATKGFVTANTPLNHGLLKPKRHGPGKLLLLQNGPARPRLESFWRDFCNRCTYRTSHALMVAKISKPQSSAGGMSAKSGCMISHCSPEGPLSFAHTASSKTQAEDTEWEDSSLVMRSLYPRRWSTRKKDPRCAFANLHLFPNLSINQQAWVFRVLDSSICAFRLGVRIIFSRFKNHRKLFQFVGPLLATSTLEPKWLRFNLLPGLLGKQQTTQGPQIQDLNHNDESMMRIMVFLNSPGPRGNKEYMTYCLMFGDTEPVWFNNK